MKYILLFILPVFFSFNTEPVTLVSKQHQICVKKNTIVSCEEINTETIFSIDESSKMIEIFENNTTQKFGIIKRNGANNFHVASESGTIYTFSVNDKNILLENNLETHSYQLKN